MSRKKAEKSNIHIGIFSGKSANYNLAILKALFELKQATTWEIAKYLSKNEEVSKEILDYRARHVYSTIQRKNGRLTDLKKKGYLEKEKGLWRLKDKGFIALGIQCPSLAEEIVFPVEFDVVNFIFDTAKGTVEQPFGINNTNALEVINELVKVSEQIQERSEVSRLVLSTVKGFLEEGIDLDRISEKMLSALLVSNSHLQEALKELLKNDY